MATTERILAGLAKLQAKIEDPDDQLGQSVSLRTISNQLRDSDKPWLGTVNVPIDLALIGIVASYNQNEIDGELVRADDVKCILLRAGLGETVPLTTDHVIWNGTTYAINHITPTFVGDTAELYELRLRA